MYPTCGLEEEEVEEWKTQARLTGWEAEQGGSLVVLKARATPNSRSHFPLASSVSSRSNF